MDAHSQDTAGADDVRGFDNLDDAATALGDYLDTGDTPDDEELPDDAETTEDGDDAETEATDEAEDDKPEAPAIDAPQSLTADEKAKFAQLPPEAQSLIADVESRRNTQVQQATTKAAEAQRTALAAAADAEAKAKQTYAQQMAAVANAYAPQPPDPAIAQYDVPGYIAQKAQYDAALAQYHQVIQHAQALTAEATSHFEQQDAAWQAEQAQRLMAVPDFADPAKRTEYLTRLQTVGEELGYSTELMASATADDILALDKAAKWKADAEKWRDLQKRKMQPVRDAKTSKPGVGSSGIKNPTSALERRFAENPSRASAAALLAQHL